VKPFLNALLYVTDWHAYCTGARERSIPKPASTPVWRHDNYTEDNFCQSTVSDSYLMFHRYDGFLIDAPS
jgi:hypothetical protein